MIRFGKAANRFHTVQPGIESWHCLSSGPHYHPDRLAFGPIVGVDEHLVAPGAGFDWHAHRGVHIASWVLEGALRHEDSNGRVEVATPGALLVQSTGDGIRHREWNASEDAPLRFLQISIVGDSEQALAAIEPPTTVGDVDVSRHVDDYTNDISRVRSSFVFATRGAFLNEGVDPIAASDWLEIDGGAGDLVIVEGEGELLVLEFDPVET